MAGKFDDTILNVIVIICFLLGFLIILLKITNLDRASIMIAVILIDALLASLGVIIWKFRSVIE